MGQFLAMGFAHEIATSLNDLRKKRFQTKN